MKSKTDYSDMSIGLNLSTSLTTWDGDPSSYVVHVSGTIMPIGGDDPEEEVGSVQAILCRLGEAMNDGVGWYDVLDSFSETAPYMELIERDDWSDKVQEVCEPLGNLDLLILDRMEVKARYRGNGFGLMAANSCMRAFGSGCGLVALKPFPLQYEAKVNPETKAHDPRAFQRDKMKLTRYWARLGFKLLENGLMVMDTTSTRPPMSQVLRKTKMPRCKRTKSVSYRVLVPTP